MSPKLTLIYFPIAGRAEPTRLTAAAGALKFTNKVVTFQEFSQIKEDKEILPLGQLPVLQIEESDGSKMTITQSEAILRYFGKKTGLYPTNEIEAMQVDSCLNVVEDMKATLVMTIKGAVKSFVSESDWTKEEVLNIRKKWLENSMPKSLGYFEEVLQNSSSGWLVGENITIADLLLYTDLQWLTMGVLDGIPKDFLNSYPKCLALMKKVESIDGIKKWQEKYSKPYSTFEYEP